ncbi:MAG: phosphatidate cytidylyltransferase, partial [Actinobacteria bacterium]
MSAAQGWPASEPQEEPAARTGRAGRNLPIAIVTALVLGGLIFGTL